MALTCRVLIHCSCSNCGCLASDCCRGRDSSAIARESFSIISGVHGARVGILSGAGVRAARSRRTGLGVNHARSASCRCLSGFGFGGEILSDRFLCAGFVHRALQRVLGSDQPLSFHCRTSRPGDKEVRDFGDVVSSLDVVGLALLADVVGFLVEPRPFDGAGVLD